MDFLWPVLVILASAVGLLLASFFRQKWENKRLITEIEHMNKALQKYQTGTFAKEEKEPPFIEVGSRVEVILGDDNFRVHGVIESLAEQSDEEFPLPGFRFRANGDRNVLWLSYDCSFLSLLDEKEEAEEGIEEDPFKRLDAATHRFLDTISGARAAGVPEEEIEAAIARGTTTQKSEASSEGE